jgi:hypothetical protein
MKNSKKAMPAKASKKAMPAKTVKTAMTAKTAMPAKTVKPTYEQKVSVINEFRRRGDVVATATRTSFAVSTVSEVFSGRYKNVTIINAAFKVANARKTAANRTSTKGTKAKARA